jgi:excisionase family DNA binding protein
MTTALSSLDRRLLTEAEVAHLFAVTRRTVRRWANSGELTPVRIGGITRYRREEVLSVIEPINEEGRPAGNGTSSENSPGQGRHGSS